MDASHEKFHGLYLDTLKAQLAKAGRDVIDYVIVSHTEPDHSGLIKDLVDIYPDVVVAGSKARALRPASPPPAWSVLVRWQLRVGAHGLCDRVRWPHHSVPVALGSVALAPCPHARHGRYLVCRVCPRTPRRAPRPRAAAAAGIPMRNPAQQSANAAAAPGRPASLNPRAPAGVHRLPAEPHAQGLQRPRGQGR